MTRIPIRAPIGEPTAYAIVDDFVATWLRVEPTLVSMNFLENLRLHRHGYPFFTRSVKSGDAPTERRKRSPKGTRRPNEEYRTGWKTETVYLNKVVATEFVPNPDPTTHTVVTHKNGNRLDLRVSNLEWRTLSDALCNRKAFGKIALPGVSQTGKRFRAQASVGGKSHYLGLYDTPEQAAEARQKFMEEHAVPNKKGAKGRGESL